MSFDPVQQADLPVALFEIAWVSLVAIPRF